MESPSSTEPFCGHNKPPNFDIFIIQPALSSPESPHSELTTSDIIPETPGPLKELLANTDVLKFHSADNFGFRGNIEGRVIHITKSTGEDLLLAAWVIEHTPIDIFVRRSETAEGTSGKYVHKYNRNKEEYARIQMAEPDDVVCTEYIMEFKDPRGKTVIICDFVSEVVGYSICIGDRLIGHLRGLEDCIFRAPKIVTQSIADEKTCHVHREGAKFTFTSNGLAIAKAKRVIDENDCLQLKFEPFLDFDTKAMVVVMAWWIYIFYCAQTRCCFPGILKLGRLWWWGVPAVFISVCFIMALCSILNS